MRSIYPVRFVIGLTTAGSLLLLIFVTFPKLGETTFDDAYMYIRYANNFLSGNGFSWNASDGSAYGFTSTVYLMVVTAIKAFTDFSNAYILTLLSFAGGLLSCLILAGTGFVYGTNLRKTWIPLLIIPWLISCASFRYHSVTGMETTFSLLSNSLLVCSVVFYQKLRSIRRLLFILVFAYLSYLTRPDNGLYCLLFPPLYLLAARSFSLKQGTAYVVAFCFIVLIDLLFKKFLFNSALPIPFYAKSTGFYVGYNGKTNWNAVEYLFRFLRDTLPFFIVVFLLVRRRTMLIAAAALMPLLLTFGYYSGLENLDS